MRISEWISGSNPVYQLKLRTVDGASVVFDAAIPTWFRLWWNEHDSELGLDNWFIKSTDRGQLEDLRFRLLDGVVPESLKNQEEMWRRINDMEESERRVAVATLAMHTFEELDRKVSETHPELGAIPEGADSAVAAVQDRKREFEQLATDTPVDPTLDRQIRQFIEDAADSRRNKPL